MPAAVRRVRDDQDSPFCVQVELTEGCNLRCTFCGLNGIRGKDNDFKFMTVLLARTVARKLAESGWTPRVEFAMHGEPSMNPNFLEILDVFRTALPHRHLMMTSNGGGFVSDPTVKVDAALEHLNVLALDWYDSVKLVPKILERYKGVHDVRRYPQDRTANPHTRRKPNERLLVVIQDIASATSGTHASLNNHAGCGGPKNDTALGKRCAKPFREISVRWDGSVAVCCNDWRGEYRCGSVSSQSFEDVWQSSAFRAARRKLYRGERDFGPCEGCDALSYRPGLLPDHRGKRELPPAGPEDEAAIRTALGQGPLTLPVLRPWEL